METILIIIAVLLGIILLPTILYIVAMILISPAWIYNTFIKQHNFEIVEETEETEETEDLDRRLKH